MVLIIVFVVYRFCMNIKKNKSFYLPEEISIDLEKINDLKYSILSEVIKLNNSDETGNLNKIPVWHDWPEKELYNKNGTWKVFPFFAFGTWVNKNCVRCPSVFKFIKNIKGLKLAVLSKLSPGMKLKYHWGWAKHSNYVIKCHYGLVVPEGCYISVYDNGKEERQYHEQFKWLIFDDSKQHYAENTSDDDRIVLIIDVERPPNIEIGKSDVGNSKELLEIVKYFKEHKI